MSNLVGSIFSGAGEGLLKGFGSAVKGIREAVTGKEIITGQERMDLVNKLHEMEIAALEADKLIISSQADINKIEAASSSAFRGNWRPAIGWVCVIGLFYQLIFQPLFPWLIDTGTILFSQKAIILPAMPKLDGQTLFSLISGILGLGGFRTFEKIRGL